MRIAVIITARPSYAKAKTVMAALLVRGVDVQILCAASALLPRYGRVRDVIAQDFPHTPITDCWATYEGATLLTSAKETGALCSELASVLDRLRPDAGMVIADRHEVLAAAQAVAYQQIPLIHLQGGEHTGSIDDKVRDAITHLADQHFVCTERAKWRVYGLTGVLQDIHHVGCPSIDLARQALADPPVTLEELGGVGCPIDLDQGFVVVLHHPVTDALALGPDQVNRIMLATLAAGMPTVVFWPGQDAGSEALARTVRGWGQKVRAVKNLPPARFLRLLTQARCLIGNSSAGIRECAYLGVPVVNIGARQRGRERAANVLDCGDDPTGIYPALVRQLARGRYPRSLLYGDGQAGARIAAVLTDSEAIMWAS